MQIEVDEICMRTILGVHGLSGFGVLVLFILELNCRADCYWQLLEHGYHYFLDAYCILGIFALLNFHENGDFNNFTKNIFANDPCGQHKRCGTALLFTKFNFATEQNSQNS